MKTLFKIAPEYRLKKTEIEFLHSLPDNLPETKLTQKQKDEVSRIYYHYLSHKVYYGWGTELWEMEKKEKWPSGSRIKDVEAKRFILGWLAYDCETRPTMTAKQAAQHFHANLTCREANQILTHAIYKEVK